MFDEFKTHLRANSTVLRSKTPELVQQELWGLLLAHFAIRQLMAQAAWARELDPDRLSFMHAVRVIKRKMPQAAAVSPERLPAARGPAGRDRARALREQSWAPEPARRQAQDEQLQCSASRRSAPFAASASAGASYLNSIWVSGLAARRLRGGTLGARGAGRGEAGRGFPSA